MSDIGKALARADAAAPAEPGRTQQLQRHLRVVPFPPPYAALQRQLDANDAQGATWLRADPAHVRPDINGARLLGIGEALRLSAQDTEAFLKPLRLLFGDAGCPIDAPHPARWYLRLPDNTRLPAFASPAEGLGDDVFETWPEDMDTRRWRTLLSEAQVILHNHPLNAQRQQQGLPVVNSLWFWGGGKLPHAVETDVDAFASEDPDLRTLAQFAGKPVTRLQAAEMSNTDARQVIDLLWERDWKAVEARWLLPALAAMRNGDLATLMLDFADGAGFEITHDQRWRFWRRPMTQWPGEIA